MQTATAATSAKGVLLKLLRYSLKDLLSTILILSHGTVMCAMATCGLPRRLSQLSSNAVHKSAPKKVGAPVMPISCRLSARGIGNRSDASYLSTYADVLPNCDCSGWFMRVQILAKNGSMLPSKRVTTPGGKSCPMPSMLTNCASLMRLAVSTPLPYGTSGSSLP